MSKRSTDIKGRINDLQNDVNLILNENNKEVRSKDAETYQTMIAKLLTAEKLLK